MGVSTCETIGMEARHVDKAKLARNCWWWSFQADHMNLSPHWLLCFLCLPGMVVGSFYATHYVRTYWLYVRTKTKTKTKMKMKKEDLSLGQIVSEVDPHHTYNRWFSSLRSLPTPINSLPYLIMQSPIWRKGILLPKKERGRNGT